MQPDPFIQEAIATLLRILSEQLTKARNAAALAQEYIDLDNPNAAIGTLLNIEKAINQATFLFNTILTLHRTQRQKL